METVGRCGGSLQTEQFPHLPNKEEEEEEVMTRQEKCEEIFELQRRVRQNFS